MIIVTGLPAFIVGAVMVESKGCWGITNSLGCVDCCEKLFDWAYTVPEIDRTGHCNCNIGGFADNRPLNTLRMPWDYDIETRYRLFPNYDGPDPEDEDFSDDDPDLEDKDDLEIDTDPDLNLDEFFKEDDDWKSDANVTNTDYTGPYESKLPGGLDSASWLDWGK